MAFGPLGIKEIYKMLYIYMKQVVSKSLILVALTNMHHFSNEINDILTTLILSTFF
jgi:hypothetical protein